MKIIKLLVLFPVAAITIGSTHADNASSTPGPLHLENTVLVAHDDTINLYNVPTSGSNAKSYNIEIHLALNPDGTVTISNSKATPTQVLPISLDQFLPGEYHCISGDTFSLTLTGPVTYPGGRRLWTFIGSGGPNSWWTAGRWLTGPAAGNPELADVDPSIPFPKGFTAGKFSNGYLFLVQQMGDKLIIGAPDQINNATTHTPQYILNKFFILQRKPDSAD